MKPGLLRKLSGSDAAKVSKLKPFFPPDSDVHLPYLWRQRHEAREQPALSHLPHLSWSGADHCSRSAGLSAAFGPSGTRPCSSRLSSKAWSLNLFELGISAQWCLLLVAQHEECRCSHNDDKWNCSEQQKGNCGPVGIHSDLVGLRHHLSKSERVAVCSFRPMFLVTLVLLVGLAPPVVAQSLKGIEHVASQCLLSGQQASCSLALRQAEVLQQRAAEIQSFPCQTLLLGLQADLIMERDGKGRGRIAMDDFSEIRRGCVGL